MGAWLVTHDGRRGHDVIAEQDKTEARQAAVTEATYTDKLAEDVQPRLAHASGAMASMRCGAAAGHSLGFARWGRLRRFLHSSHKGGGDR